MQRTRTVVIIDDEHMMRQILKFIVNSYDYQVIGEASNGGDAIDLCEKLKPDLVLLDINMPRMNGLLALELIQQQSPASKIIMVSADSKRVNVEEAIRRGASGYVLKPFNAINVMDRIDNCFEIPEGTLNRVITAQSRLAPRMR